MIQKSLKALSNSIQILKLFSFFTIVFVVSSAYASQEKILKDRMDFLSEVVIWAQYAQRVLQADMETPEDSEDAAAEEEDNIVSFLEEDADDMDDAVSVEEAYESGFLLSMSYADDEIIPYEDDDDSMIRLTRELPVLETVVPKQNGKILSYESFKVFPINRGEDFGLMLAAAPDAIQLILSVRLTPEAYVRFFSGTQHLYLDPNPNSDLIYDIPVALNGDFNRMVLDPSFATTDPHFFEYLKLIYKASDIIKKLYGVSALSETEDFYQRSIALSNDHLIYPLRLNTKLSYQQASEFLFYAAMGMENMNVLEQVNVQVNRSAVAPVCSAFLNP